MSFSTDFLDLSKANRSHITLEIGFGLGVAPMLFRRIDVSSIIYPMTIVFYILMLVSM